MLKPVEREHTSANLMGAIERHGMGRALDSTPTWLMRESLKQQGVKLPSADEMTALSRQFNTWLEELRRDKGLDHSTSWFNSRALTRTPGAHVAQLSHIFD